MADEATKKMSEDKKTLEQQNAERQKVTEERNKNRGKPTPTQMECDLMKLGNHPELEPDGSLPDPNHPSPTAAKKEVHAGSGGSYSTRQQTAKTEK